MFNKYVLNIIALTVLSVGPTVAADLSWGEQPTTNASTVKVITSRWTNNPFAGVTVIPAYKPVGPTLNGVMVSVSNGTAPADAFLIAITYRDASGAEQRQVEIVEAWASKYTTHVFITDGKPQAVTSVSVKPYIAPYGDTVVE
jgi:hypothetical protein